MSPRRVALVMSVIAAGLVGACGKKEEPPQASKVKFDCSFAPSQSKVFTALASAGGGASATTAAIAQMLGLTAVAHSSGGLILTGGSGYIAGTLGSAFILPAVVFTGAGAGAVAVAVELICFPTNHPESAEKLSAAVGEFMQRTRESTGAAYELAAPTSAKLGDQVTQSGADVIEYARRKSVEVEEAIRSAVK